MKNNFEIDFFELTFLAVACIPPSPIARTMFWQRLCTSIYDELDKQQRSNMFEWVTREHGFDKEDDDCHVFYDRYDPNNQYEIEYNLPKDKERGVLTCFFHKGFYRTNKTTKIDPKYITNITRL